MQSRPLALITEAGQRGVGSAGKSGVCRRAGRESLGFLSPLVILPVFRRSSSKVSCSCCWPALEACCSLFVVCVCEKEPRVRQLYQRGVERWQTDCGRRSRAAGRAKPKRKAMNDRSRQTRGGECAQWPNCTYTCSRDTRIKEEAL